MSGDLCDEVSRDVLLHKTSQTTADCLTRAARHGSLVVFFCVVPVACIWLPDVLGNYAGIFSITTTSPASFVWFLGWVVLLLPVIVVPLVWLEGVGLGPGG